MKKNLLALFFVFLFTFFSFSCAYSKKVSAPDVRVKGLSGTEFKLSSQKGKVVFLNFWASWCPPCREEMPSIQKLYNGFKGEKIVFAAISIDRGGKDTVAPFIKKNLYTFPVYLDQSGIAASKYEVLSIPTTFIIDKKGNIAAKIVGAIDWNSDEVKTKIKKIIAE